MSLTSVCCKILEQLIREEMMTYLLGNGLLSNKQYGFISGRSTSLQLLHMLDRWTDYLEYGGQIDVLYSDFKKAFDKVPHSLLSKLLLYGISNLVINWISNQIKSNLFVTKKIITRIWHVPAKHANRMDARAHSSTLAECAPRFMMRGTHDFVDQSSPNLAHV